MNKNIYLFLTQRTNKYTNILNSTLQNTLSSMQNIVFLNNSTNTNNR